MKSRRLMPAPGLLLHRIRPDDYLDRGRHHVERDLVGSDGRPGWVCASFWRPASDFRSTPGTDMAPLPKMVQCGNFAPALPPRNPRSYGDSAQNFWWAKCTITVFQAEGITDVIRGGGKCDALARWAW